MSKLPKEVIEALEKLGLKGIKIEIKEESNEVRDKALSLALHSWEEMKFELANRLPDDPYYRLIALITSIGLASGNVFMKTFEGKSTESARKDVKQFIDKLYDFLDDGEKNIKKHQDEKCEHCNG